nr:translation initiation factor IF-2-like [Equus asinus]
MERRGSPLAAAQARRPGRARLRGPRAAIAPPRSGLRAPLSRLRGAALGHAGPRPARRPRPDPGSGSLSRRSPPRSFPFYGCTFGLPGPRPPGYANHLGTCKTNPAPGAPLARGGLELITMQGGEPPLAKETGSPKLDGLRSRTCLQRSV